MVEPFTLDNDNVVLLYYRISVQKGLQALVYFIPWFDSCAGLNTTFAL